MPRNQSGLLSIMMALSMTLVLGLIALVINLGMLVHAKINLQNAADLAAYSGAAVQARAMTSIAHLNYELRRNYKEFLFKYYVIGNISNGQFPGVDGNLKINADNTFLFPWRDQQGSPLAMPPRVCILVRQDDKYCDLAKIPGLIRPPPIPGDGISIAIQKFYEKATEAKIEDLNDIRSRNSVILGTWLYGVNIAPPAPQIDPQNPTHRFQLRQPGGFRLGLVWANAITRLRIAELERIYFARSPIQRTITSDAQFAVGGNDPGAESTALALRTVERNLSSVFSGSPLEFEELLPPIQSAGESFLGLTDLPINIAPLYIEPEVNEPGGGAKSAPKPLNARFTVAVWRASPDPIYYGVVLRASPRLLFNPWGDGEVILTATAIAKPFGATIGPAVTEGHFVTRASWADPGGAIQSAPIPNIALLPDGGGIVENAQQSGGANRGFFQSGVLASFCAYVGCGRLQPTQGTNNETIRANLYRALHAGIQYARSVDLAEVGQYLIPIDGGLANPPNTILKSGDPPSIQSIGSAGIIEHPPPNQTSADGYASSSYDLYRVPRMGPSGLEATTPSWNSAGSVYKFFAPLPLDQLDQQLRVQLLNDANDTTANQEILASIELLKTTLQERGEIYTATIEPPISYQPDPQSIGGGTIARQLHDRYKATLAEELGTGGQRDPRRAITAWFDPMADAQRDRGTAQLANRRSQYSVKLVHPSTIPQITGRYELIKRTGR